MDNPKTEELLDFITELQEAFLKMSADNPYTAIPSRYRKYFANFDAIAEIVKRDGERKEKA